MPVALHTPPSTCALYNHIYWETTNAITEPIDCVNCGLCVVEMLPPFQNPADCELRPVLRFFQCKRKFMVTPLWVMEWVDNLRYTRIEANNFWSGNHGHSDLEQLLVDFFPIDETINWDACSDTLKNCASH